MRYVVLRTDEWTTIAHDQCQDYSSRTCRFQAHSGLMAQTFMMTSRMTSGFVSSPSNCAKPLHMQTASRASTCVHMNRLPEHYQASQAGGSETWYCMTSSILHT